MPDYVYRTAVGSLAAQVIIGLVTAAGFFVRVKDPDDARELNVILGLELGSQLIEFLWYVVVVSRYSTIVTWSRYLDWFISTPIMLASTVLFFSHRSANDFESPFIGLYVYMVFVANWVMILFGFLVETGRIYRPVGLCIGSIAFITSFTSLATHVDGTDGLSQGLFWFTYAVWSGYGLAAILPYTGKNIAYNSLDIVAKNFYGVFLFVYLFTLA